MKAYPAITPPDKKMNWEHTCRVLVWYLSNEEHDAEFGIAYYHYKPPFENSPKWVDFSGRAFGRTPAFWWELPDILHE